MLFFQAVLNIIDNKKEENLDRERKREREREIENGRDNRRVKHYCEQNLEHNFGQQKIRFSKCKC